MQPTDQYLTSEEPQGKQIDELNSLYKESEECDKAHFSEARVNILLVAGNHYFSEHSKYWRTLRETRSQSANQAIRLTKNHMGRITKLYQNFILSANPEITISPRQEKEIQHQKVAELFSSVNDFIKSQHDLERKKFLWCKDYTEIGEVAVKVFWDPTLGKRVGFEPEVDENGQVMLDPATGEVQLDPMTGQPVVDPVTGQPVLINQKPILSNVPIMSGDLVFETIHGFDLLRKNGVRSMDETPFFIIRKMESTKDLKKKFSKDEDKLKFIADSANNTFTVFKSESGWHQTKDMTAVREFYFKPCAEYPEGYYYITTELGILAEGPLPFGIFPIHYCGFDELTTNPRSKSILRQLKPYQVELNKMGSLQSQISSTLGLDRVWYQSGSKPSSGATKPGIRENSYVGAPPIVIPGSAGDQYLQSISQIIAEMYQVADLSDFDQELNGQLDPYALLFRSMKQKQKFSFYTEKFNQFQIKVRETALKLYKRYVHDSMLIPSIGKNEMVNIAEFKSADDLCYQIKIEGMSDDIESKLGKQLTLNHYLQYVGAQLKPEDIGKMIRLSPYLNMEKMFETMTQDYDNLNNDILALDRGKMPKTDENDNHAYIVAGLKTRMKQADFDFLPPQIQAMYQQKVMEHNQILAKQQAAIKAAEAGFIPTGGYLVTTDFYLPQKDATKKPERARVPSEALGWLIKHITDQGTSQDQLLNIGNNQVLAEIATL